MTSNRLTENQIQVCIIPRHMRWPEPGTGTVWAKAATCVHALQDFCRKADQDCLQAEQNEELSVDAIRRRRVEIYDRAMTRLTNFRPFQIAEKALRDNIISLERLGDLDSEQVEILQKLQRALIDLREGIPAAQRLLQERCKMRERVSA